MSEQSKQTWLILSHAYNMDGRAASQTITDKIPHLIKLGVRPIIVSGALGRKDDVVEHHQVLPALPVGLRFDLRHYLKNRTSNKAVYRLMMFLVSVALMPIIVLEKIFIPIETTWSWSISAFIVGRRIIRKERPTLIYSTGGAYAAHIAGYWLSKAYAIPWIAEIHDPMIFEAQPATKTRKRFLAKLEKIICTHADIVWWFTEMAMERAKERNPQLAERGHYVIAGVDAPDFRKVSYEKTDHLSIGHFGSLSETRNLHVFLAALKLFLERDLKRISQVRLHLYGGSMDAISARAISEFPYPEVIQNFGRLEADPITGESGRVRVLKQMNSKDCLLLLHGTVPFCEEYIPSKLYEYLWTQRPILALVHNNAQLNGILREFNHWAVDAENIEEITRALDELYGRWILDDLVDSDTVSPYTTLNAVKTVFKWTTQMKKGKEFI